LFKRYVKAKYGGRIASGLKYYRGALNLKRGDSRKRTLEAARGGEWHPRERRTGVEVKSVLRADPQYAGGCLTILQERGRGGSVGRGHADARGGRGGEESRAQLGLGGWTSFSESEGAPKKTSLGSWLKKKSAGRWKKGDHEEAVGRITGKRDRGKLTTNRLREASDKGYGVGKRRRQRKNV